jgi:hypothetical protein
MVNVLRPTPPAEVTLKIVDDPQSTSQVSSFLLSRMAGS